jgi:hypothetical protein
MEIVASCLRCVFHEEGKPSNREVTLVQSREVFNIEGKDRDMLSELLPKRTMDKDRDMQN